MDFGVSATLLGVSATVLAILVTFHRYFSSALPIKRELRTTILICISSATINVMGMLQPSWIYITSLLSAGLIVFLLVWIARALRA